jgi:hypothetical protein
MEMASCEKNYADYLAKLNLSYKLKPIADNARSRFGKTFELGRESR